MLNLQVGIFTPVLTGAEEEVEEEEVAEEEEICSTWREEENVIHTLFMHST